MLSGESIISGLLKLWMNSSPPPKAMDLPPPSHTQTYYNLLINAYVRSDKTKKANVGKRRNVYSSTVGPAYLDYPLDVSDQAPESPLGGIDLPSDEFYQIHTLSSRHPPPPSVYSTRHLSSAEDKNFPFCPQLRT